MSKISNEVIHLPVALEVQGITSAFVKTEELSEVAQELEDDPRSKIVRPALGDDDIR